MRECSIARRMVIRSEWPGANVDPEAARARMAASPRPRWLTFIGTSNGGKTTLATHVHAYARFIDYALGDARFGNWGDLEHEMYSRNWKPYERIREAGFAVIDDLGAGRDKDFTVSKLLLLLESRLRKWTVITSNLTMAQIESLDVRIAGRLIRNGSSVVRIETEDYHLRKK